MEYMKVDKIKLIANEGEVLSLEYEDVYYPAIKLKRCFPFKCPTSYISVCNSENDHEIGIIYDLNELDSKMLQIAIDELNFRYFVPVINKISKIKEKRNFAHFDIITNSGNKKITLQDIPFNINAYPNGQVLIKDVDGNLYEVSQQYLSSNDKNAKYIKNYL